jgi:hypothetical protein
MHSHSPASTVLQKIVYLHLIPYGLTARIAGFHPAGPGSTPGMGIFLYVSNFVKLAADKTIKFYFRG